MTDASIFIVPAGAAAGGAEGEIQYRGPTGLLDAEEELYWNATANRLGVDLASPPTGLDQTLTVSGTAYSKAVALTDAATVAVDLSVGNSFVLGLTALGSRVLGTPTNLSAGATYLFRIEQPPAGGEALTYATEYKFAGGSDGALSVAGSAVDVLSCYCDGTSLLCQLLKAFS